MSHTEAQRRGPAHCLCQLEPQGCGEKVCQHRELLAIVFACQHFSTYLLGRSFVAESNHKPLEMIAMKNLVNAPTRLQRMLLELQRYDVTIKYRPRNQMQLVDALSRCPARASQEIKLDMRVDYIAFTKPWIEKLKDSMQRDPILAMVYQLTQQGWPHQQRHVPHVARRYWDFRDELSTDDGMLLQQCFHSCLATNRPHVQLTMLYYTRVRNKVILIFTNSWIKRTKRIWNTLTLRIWVYNV